MPKPYSSEFQNFNSSSNKNEKNNLSITMFYKKKDQSNDKKIKAEKQCSSVKDKSKQKLEITNTFTCYSPKNSLRNKDSNFELMTKDSIGLNGKITPTFIDFRNGESESKGLEHGAEVSNWVH